MLRADELQALEGQRLRALVVPDMGTAERLHADDYQLVNPYGGTVSKQDYLSWIAVGDINYHVFEPVSELLVRISPAMAVVRYQARIDIESAGEREQLVCWHTDMYELRDGGWQAVWSQATAIR